MSTATTAPITTTRVRFDNDAGETLVGDLHRPVGAAGDLPALVVTGSWLTVKEQMAGLYARRLAAEGVVTLAFDFAGFGQSQGQPREVEHPGRKAADIHAAVGFLTSVRGVDAERIGGLGVCASAGYQALNAVGDDRVRALGLVAPWLHDPQLVEDVYGGPEGVADLRAQAETARRRYEEDGTVEYVPAISPDDPAAAMTGPFDYYLDPDRGAIPEWGARFATMAWTDWLGFDAVSLAADVHQPVAMIHGHDGAVPDGATAFFERLPDPAGLTWIDGGQLDFYDQPAQVDQSVQLMVEHFRTAL